MRRSQADVRISLVCKVIFDSCHVSLVSLENITNMNAYAEEVDTAFSGPGQGVKVKDLCHLYVMFHFSPPWRIHDFFSFMHFTL